MPISIFKIKQCKLAPTVTVLCTHKTCTNVLTKPFYVHQNQCMQILNLSSTVKCVSYVLNCFGVVLLNISRYHRN